MRRLTLATVILAMLPVLAAEAHHSYGAYEKELTTIEGTVREFMWMSPHSFVVVETEDGTKYMAEWAAAAALRRQGLDESSIRPGDRVILAGCMHKTASGVMALRELQRPGDGFRWPLRSAAR